MTMLRTTEIRVTNLHNLVDFWINVSGPSYIYFLAYGNQGNLIFPQIVLQLRLF